MLTTNIDCQCAGAELAYLPDAFFDTVIRKGSCVHASKVEGTVNDPRPTYLFDQGSVRRDLALQLCFSLRNGRFGCLNVAPIRDAMHFRRCRDQGNRFFLAAHPASALPDLKEGTALIGLVSPRPTLMILCSNQTRRRTG